VSGLAIFKGSQNAGLVPNKVFGVLDTKPRHVGFTLNSDTPYGTILLDLRSGAMIVDVPAGSLIGVALDLNQRWIADLGLTGPDAGKGGRYLLLPPRYEGTVPGGFYFAPSTTNRIVVAIRSLPVGGDVERAIALIKTVKAQPLVPSRGWAEPSWIDLTDQPQDTTPVGWEDNLDYWKALHEVIASEPPFHGYAAYYGELAALGIVRSQPFPSDARRRRILGEAARIGSAELRVRAFADRRPDRVVWSDRKWEWAALRSENAEFKSDGDVDLEAREKWFYQAIGVSPAMFRRQAGSGSLYWLGTRDATGAYLDGGKSYTLTVPRPVPCELFWSVTVYDAETRSQVQTPQQKAALRSLFELTDGNGSGPARLHFGPSAPSGEESRWIQTMPGKGWFAYFRLYGPERPALDGSWKPGDFTAADLK
jgi:hypothetical protein